MKHFSFISHTTLDIFESKTWDIYAKNCKGDPQSSNFKHMPNDLLEYTMNISQLIIVYSRPKIFRDFYAQASCTMAFRAVASTRSLGEK